MDEKESTTLSLEQRNALDAVRRACKDGQISNSSLYALLSNLKSDLNLKSTSDELRATMPKHISEILDVKAGDTIQWQPTIIDDHIFVLVKKKKESP